MSWWKAGSYLGFSKVLGSSVGASDLLDRRIPMATSIAAGSGKLNFKERVCWGHGCRQTSWVSGVAFQRFELKELSWSSGLSKLLQVRRCNPSSSPINANSKPPRTVTAPYQTDGSTKYFDFAVIGSGVAGLHYALEVAKHGTVAVITKAEPHESNTSYAQGGESAVLCPSVEKDTIVAGAHLCDEETIMLCLVGRFEEGFGKGNEKNR
ncbi:hypothetical protein HYC85_024114 [Camellia sinensis]|uniref:FAD-dependent oxidoreductase 2 FAD-binding domain-containing protein n=1 Tax=Camellia sinensis TaxID=4442 RepID=A0A7J7GAV5_CAMSI|nr:hypothetical protein HYC85_024114 [Camellia sinensis]